MAIPLRFLIDECLSPGLESVASRRGLEAAHVSRRGLTSEPDWSLVQYCVANDLIVVTNNAVDFRLLYRRLALHPGLIIILPQTPKAEQELLFDLVLLEISGERDLVNKLVEIDRAGTIARSELHAPDAGGA